MLGAGAQADAERVRALHAGRRGGRLFAFPGSDIAGRTSVGELVAGSAIDQVVMVGHRERVADDQVIDTQGHLRPEQVDGLVRLVVRPAAGGLIVPFEQPSPTPCCAAH